MEAIEIVRSLKKWGYLPKVADDNLTLRSSQVRNAIERYTSIYAPESITDDGRDESFQTLVENRFCDVPDFPPEGAESANGPQEANWPTSCRGNLRFGLTFANLPGMTQEQTRLAFIAAMNTMNLATDARIVPNANWARQGSHIWAGTGRLSGSTLAWSYVAQNRCDAVLEQRYNSGRSWANFWQTVAIAAHELIHAWGGMHINTAGALMRPEINSQSVARKGWMSTADFQQMQRLGYKIVNTVRPSDEVVMRLPGSDPPVPPEPPVPPTPPTDPNDPFVGTWTAPNGKRYVMSPFPEF